MTLQTDIFIGWLAASAAVAIVFYIIYRRSVDRPMSAGYDIINRERFKFFYIVVLLSLAIFFVTLSGSPYSLDGRPDDVIGVKARMFSFELTKDTVQHGHLVEFRVSTEDVTHGFGVYAPGGTLMGQVQTTPGYVNRLRIRFDEPGRYDIFCLEYCGSNHHQMRDTVFVQ